MVHLTIESVRIWFLDQDRPTPGRTPTGIDVILNRPLRQPLFCSQYVSHGPVNFIMHWKNQIGKER